MARPRAPKQQITIDWGDLVNKHSGLLVRYGGLGFIVCLAYFIYAIYGGTLQSADPARAYVLISGFGKGLVLSGFVLAVGIVLFTLEELAYSILVAIGGVGVMLGIPYMVASNLGQTAGQGLQRVTEQLSKSGTQAGVAMLAVVGLRILYEIYIQVKDAPERRRVRSEKETADDTGVLKKHATIKPQTVLSPCWELPFCHDRIREVCPAYKARRPCWRYGIGCNCDPGMIETLIRMGAPGKGPKSNERKNIEGAYIRSDLEADKPLAKRAERTIPCAKCPIYNEHQRLKFKFVNPIGIIGTIVLMAVLYVPITTAWSQLAAGIVQVATQITLNSGFDAGDWFSYLRGTTMQIFFFLFVSLMALSYVLKFTEWVVLQKKL